MTTRIDKYPALQVLNGSMNLTFFKEATNIGFKEPDGTSKYSPDFVWKAEEVKAFLKQYIHEFRNNIFTPAESFMSALKLSRDSLKVAFNKEPDYMFSHIKYTSGVMLRDASATFFRIEKDKRIMTVVTFLDDMLASGYKNIALHEDHAYSELYKAYVPEGLAYNSEGMHEIQQLRNICDTTALITMFRSYADHEVKTIGSKSSGTVNSVQYKNLNKHNIHVIDSSWYTTITRTEGFMVRGHLRMQPCGPNMSERKLIYIDSFEKHGYTRKAKMLPRSNPSISTITEALYE